jgi:uncharacterized repeat protein (TIGR03803 family)
MTTTMKTRNARSGLTSGLRPRAAGIISPSGCRWLLLLPLFLAGVGFAPAAYAQAAPPAPPNLPGLQPPPALHAPVTDPSGLLATLPPPPALPTGTRVVTDQADYAPGATAHIRGQEFQAGETVRLQVLHVNGPNDNSTSPAHQPWQVTAGTNGSFQTTWGVPAAQDEMGALLQLTATGLTSGKTALAVFTDAPAAPTYQQLKSFGKPSPGAYPYGGLIRGADGALYGTASQGGSSFVGTVFKLNADGTGFTVIKNFDNFMTGGYPLGKLVQGTDGALYGTAQNGGSSGQGTVFKLNTDGTGFIVLKGDFNSSTSGGYLYSGLMQAADGRLYGTASQGGSGNYGTVFKLNTDGTSFSVIKNFAYFDGADLQVGELIQGMDGALYGTAVNGGSSGGGTVFKLNTDGSAFTVLKNLSYGVDISEDGGYIYTGLAQGTDGALYGTASQGGSSGAGTVFKLNADGTGFTVIKDFDNSTTGGYPQGGALIQGTDGKLYGNASQGGTYGYGTVFKLNTDGSGFSVLQNFDNSTTGGYLYSGLMQGTDGALYGTAASGGTYGYGTVFKLNPDGTGFSVLKNFDYSTSGGNSYYSTLMQGTDGAIYGTALQGGSSGYGTVFRLNPTGSGFTVLKGDFNSSTSGGYLYSGLMQGADSALYGTAYYGGGSSYGTLFKLNTDGTGFTVLQNFDYYATGGFFEGGGLVQRADGTIYGTALQGGSSGAGTVFQLNPDGTAFSVFLNFDNAANGCYPYGKLIQGTDGNLYGTTAQGGNGVGTVFRLVFPIIAHANTAPVARCKDVTVSAGAACTADASIDNGSFDPDAGDTITVAQTPAGPYPPGPTTVTLTVTDNHGASSTCTATVTVVDTTPPVIIGCPANITVQTGPGRTTCDQVATWAPPTASDNCTVASFTSNHLPGDTFPVGTTTVTYTAKDGATPPNTTTCSFTVTVVDTTPPVITGCPANITVQTGPGRTTDDQVATWTAPIASDNCSVASFTSDHLPGDTFPVGTTTVTYTARDGATPPNTTTCSFTVTVVDTTPPVIVCPANQYVIASNGHENHFHTGVDDGKDHDGLDDHDDDKDGDGNYCDGQKDDRPCGTVVVYKKVTATDNCGGNVTVVCTPPSGSAMGLGVHTVNCTATDANGNQSSCSFTVTVLSPLHVVIQSPLYDDNIDNNAPKPSGQDPQSTTEQVNLFKVGDKLLHKVKLYDCNGNDVTTSLGSSVSVRLAVTLRNGSYTSGAVVSDLVVASSGVGGVGNLMVLSNGTYQYNLATTGYEAGTSSGRNLDFFQSLVWVEYNAVPGVDVGRENVILESR